MGKKYTCCVCGKTFDKDIDNMRIYVVDDKYYCEPCALKLPKHLMKKCAQCGYYWEEGIDAGLCSYHDKLINRLDDACVDYKSRYVLFHNDR